MILDLERWWGQAPGWLATLPVERQADVIAHYQIRAEGSHGDHSQGRRGQRRGQR